jgi:nucleoside 2-deoxyribosyltransferase
LKKSWQKKLRQLPDFFTKEKNMANIYLAGGLFNAGERLHNLFLAKHLTALGHKVIVPQIEALKFFKNNSFDTTRIAESCREACQDRKNILVGNTDGADADSGTCVEYGIAIAATGRAVLYRTDFRTAPEKEIGINAMLGVKDTISIYHPCFFTSLDEIEKYYKELALKIHQAIRSFPEAAATE